MKHFIQQGRYEWEAATSRGSLILKMITFFVITFEVSGLIIAHLRAAKIEKAAPIMKAQRHE